MANVVLCLHIDPSSIPESLKDKVEAKLGPVAYRRVSPTTSQELLDLSREPGVVAIYQEHDLLPQKVLEEGTVPIITDSGRGLPLQLREVVASYQAGISNP